MKAQDDGIPITISDYGLPFVPLAVNGRPAIALLDTGSVRGVQISARLQGEAGVRADAPAGTNQRYEGGGRAVFAGVAEVALGGWHGPAEPVQIVPGDIERIAGQIGTPFDAIVGWPLLSRFDFAIDYRAGRLQLESGAMDDSDWIVALDTAKALPVAAAAVGGHEMLVLIDTGAPTCNIDVGATSEPSGRLIALPCTVAHRTVTVDFRVKDLGPVRQALGCLGVLGHNFLAGRQIRYRRAARAFVLG